MSERKPPNVGAQVRALRTERGLSMRGLAELCELSPNAISLIERGSTSPSVSTLHRLATALRVPITAFFEGQEERVELILSQAGKRSYSGTDSVLLESLGAGLDHERVAIHPGRTCFRFDIGMLDIGCLDSAFDNMRAGCERGFRVAGDDLAVDQDVPRPIFVNEGRTNGFGRAAIPAGLERFPVDGEA